MIKRSSNCAICENTNRASICSVCVNHRLIEYNTLLKSLKTRRDSLHSKLSELLEAKGRADDQKNWRLLQNEKISNLKNSLRRNKEQLTQGKAKIERESRDLKLKYGVLDSARSTLEKIRVEQVEKYFPNLICTQSLGHMAISSERLHKQSVVVKQICKLFPQRQVGFEGEIQNGSGGPFNLICNSRLPKGLDPHSIPSEELAASLGLMVQLLNLVVHNLAAPALHSSGFAVIVDGTYALHARLRSLLDIRVAVVGGVHFSLLSKVRYDIGDSCSLDYLIDSIFPLFRKHIEPDLHHAQIRINNSFVSSFREAIYKLKCKSEIVTSFAQGSEVQKDNFIEMYLRPPSANEEARINDWIKVRQAGIRYYLSLGDQRIVDKHFIIRPKAEFEVGRMTLGGLLALGYNVVVSYKRASTAVSYGNLSLSRETIDTLGETFLVLRGTDRKSVGAEALRMGISGPWITKSYLELILESKGVPRLNTPPLLQQSPVTVNQEKQIVAPKPIRTTPNIVTRLEDLSQPWTRSPTKSQMEPMVATWHFTSFDAPHSVSSGVDSSFRENIRLVPMPDSYDLDRGLLLSVQAIQALLENKGPPVIVGIGGPSGSGKTSLAHKMANIVGCEVVSLESYFKSEQVKDFKHDDFSSLDLPLLSKNIADITNSRRTKLPVFDLETGTRCGFKELEVSEECGVIIFEGVYALHPEIRQSLDLWVAVVGGVHSHLISRVQRDKSRVGCFMSQNEIMMTVFPMFQQHIEPHLVHAHVKIRNDFDPVFSPESSLFVLKSNKQVPYQDILSILDSTKFCSSVQNFIDIYFRLSGLPANGQLSDSDCIRVRICEGRFAVLIREPIREGNFIVQPKVDFDISVSTVAGLLNLGYQAVAYIEASAFIYQDGKILIEVDHLQDVPSPYIQIKGVNKKAVTAAGSALKLDGSYTTKSYLQIVLERLPPVQRSSSGIHTQQAARLQELVEFIQSQGSSNSASEASPRRDGSSIDNVLDDMQSRIKRLERWHTINTVLWTFLMSALVGYSLYQRKRQ